MDIQVGYFPQTFMLVIIRVAAIVGLLSFFGGAAITGRLRLALILGISIALMPMVPPEWSAAASEIRTGGDVFLAILGELLLGAAVALVCNVMNSVYILGGEVIGRQTAMSMARELNPESGIQNPVIAIMMQKLGILLVLLTGAHLVVIQMIGESFFAIPPQLAWLNLDILQALIGLGRGMYIWAIKLAAPVLGIAMVVNVAMGLMARLAPNFNILFLALPIRIFAGITGIGLVLKFGRGFFDDLIRIMLEGCAMLLTRGV
jgi:flagellar biosynthetic protein FliR